MKKKDILNFILIIIFISLDQISKFCVVSNMKLYSSIKIIPNFFSITYNTNYGAAFGSFEGQKYLFYIITIIVLIYFFKEYKKYNINNLTRVSLILIISGIIGNFIDRIIHGYVIDYLDFNIFSYNFPIFNFADSLMVIGVIILIIYTIMEEKWKSLQKKKE